MLFANITEYEVKMGPIPDSTGLNKRQNPDDRRKRPTHLFRKHTLLGRRKGHRRTTDPRSNYYVDLYSPWLFAVLVLIIILSLLDGIFTYNYVSHGGKELNPIMQVLIEKGALAFFPYKFFITSLGVIILCLHKNFTFVRSLTYLVLFIYVLLIFYHVGLLYAF